MGRMIKRPDKTSARSYFDFAESFWLSASALREVQVKNAPNRAYPIFFLYYHAIELYLKAYLRAQGMPADVLQSEFRHDAGKLSKYARKMGASIKPKEAGLFDLAGKANAAILVRYQSGGYRLPSMSALERACKCLREITGQALSRALACRCLASAPDAGRKVRRRSRRGLTETGATTGCVTPWKALYGKLVAPELSH